MRLTRGISVCALGLAIMLAIGAVTPYQPFASAKQEPIILIATLQPYVVPTPALPTPALAAPVEQLPAAPQVVYVELPTPEPQIVYIEQPAAAPQAASVEQAAPVEQPAAAPQSDPAMTPGTPEFQAALIDAYKSLPTLQCPCGVDASAPAGAMTERQQQQSRQRTR